MSGDSGSSSGERSSERYKRARLTSAATLAAHGMQVLAQLLVVPLALGYLGPERFGLWMALLGMVAIVSFADLGLGAGLQNAIAEAQGRGDRSAARRYFSSALILLFCLSLVFVYIALFLLPRYPLADWLGVEAELARAEVLPATQALLICLAVGLPAGLVTRLYNGLQEGYVPKIWLAAGRALALAAVWICIQMEMGLSWMAAAYTGLPFLMLLLAGNLMIARRPWLLPSPSLMDRECIGRILGPGLAAFAVQLALVLVTSGIPLVIAARLGAESLPPFAVTQRFLWLPTMLVGVLVYPLWPAYREALARGDWAFLGSGLRRSFLYASAIQIPFLLLMVVAGQGVIELWTQDGEVVPETSLLYAMCVWSLLATFSTVCMIFLFGMERMRTQAIYSVITALAAIWVCSENAAEWGTAGIAWGMVLVCGLPRALCYALEVGLQMRKLGFR
ncbi:MAG: lipopolysaccharide biosynthesis protein [Planctomycetota bacterium]|jgi:O-antigen/teichoic acid export membrane protein